MPHHKTKTAERETAPETTGHTIRWWARFYDLIGWACSFGQEPAIRRQTLAVAAVQPGDRLLDVGCGTGTLVLMAYHRTQPGGSVAGIDASPEMIEIARRKARKRGVDADFQTAPIEDLPFPDASFDVVLSTFMLHHLPDDLKPAGFAEVARVLRPGGRFVAVDLADSNRSLPGRIIALFGHKMPEGYLDGLAASIRHSGLDQVEIVPTRFKPLGFIRARKPTAPAPSREEAAAPAAEVGEQGEKAMEAVDTGE